MGATIAKKIHDENPSAEIKINLAGLGIGDGFMSPPDSSVYGDYLYHVSYFFTRSFQVTRIIKR